MARNTFGIGSLNAAQPGLSKLAAALVGGKDAYQAGFDGTVNAQSKVAQTLAEIRAQNAAAGAHDAQAAETRAKTATLAGRPDLFNTQVANLAGTDVPTLNGYLSQLKTGVAPQVPMGPPTEDGDMGVGSLVIPDDKRSKIASAIQQFLPLLANTGDLKPDDLAKAASEFRNMGLGDAILNGSANRNAVAGAQAAVAAKPLYNTSADGAVLDQYGGGLATDNPMARSTIALRGAQAGEASARGRLAVAQTGEVGAPKFDANSGLIIDARAGTGRSVIGPDGKPIGGKSVSLNQEQSNALGFGSRMQDADTVLTQLASKGVMRPGAIYTTAGSIPLVGGLAQTLTNGTQSDDQQQVDQAKRNFVNATLRRESGASISPAEFDNADRQYFPQPGDKPGVLAQKAANRKRVIQAMFAAVPENMRHLPPVDDSAPEPAGKPIPVPY